MTASIPIVVQAPQDNRTGRRREPLTAGIPLPRGMARADDRWTLSSADGTVLPVQTAVTDLWPDGSVRWLLVDSQITVGAGESAVPLTLGPASAAGASAPSSCAVRTDAGVTTVATDGLTAVLRPGQASVLAATAADAAAPVDVEVRIVDPDGAPWSITWQSSVVGGNGPLRVATVSQGTATNAQGVRLLLLLHLEFYAGHPVVRARLTVRNQRRAAHPGGIWELGDSGSIFLKELAIVVRRQPSADAALMLSAEPGHAVNASQRVSILQESSGGDNWSSPNHRNQHGAVSLRFQGYRAHADDRKWNGLRATPIVTLRGERDTVGAAVPYFWQNFPRALEATATELRIGFFPGDTVDPHELQGGEQKTHEVYLCFAGDSVTDAPLEWCRSRLVMHAAPRWYEHAAAIAHLVTREDEDPRYRALVDAAIEGDDSFAHKREVADEYGWRHFGDVYGDHEAVFNTSPVPLMSHYNNQYDPVLGFFSQFMRTGDVRWWSQCVELAAHVTDIDVYHTDEDKSAYNNGLFWHTYHYVDAGKSTHRSYPAGTGGGGPSSEQNYPTGLMLYYFATGDPLAREAAEGLSRFVIGMDDGARTVFRYLSRGHTGVASASRTPDYQGPGRGSGNSLNALVDGYRLTGDRVFLDKAEQIIRRCTHPRQDITSLTLLDPENRWFYTMYLQSLGKYLRLKAELDELDAMYAYGRDVLLHFARWMAENERPYLDHPEQLEYPNETWAAQDIRKSEIFDCAASHADPAEATRFLERAEFFFRYSIDTLTQMGTRTLARPVVLLLVHGLARAHTRKHGLASAPSPRESWTDAWPRPERFVPQKAQAKQRLVGLAGGAAAIFGSAIAWWLLH